MDTFRSQSEALPHDPLARTPELDGVVAAPAHHRVLFEDDAVRVVESHIPAWEETPVHSHARRRLVIALSGSSFSRHDDQGRLLEATWLDKDGRVHWAEAMGIHSIRNTGPDDLVVVAVELLDARRSA